MRRDFKETRSKSCLQTSRLETWNFFNKVYFFFDQYIICGRSVFISFCSRCSSVTRPRGFTLKTSLVIVREWSWAYVFKSGGKSLWKVQTPNTSETSVSCALPQVFFTTLEHISTRSLTHNHEWCFECEPSGSDYSVTTWTKTNGHRTPTNNILIKKEINLIKKD